MLEEDGEQRDEEAEEEDPVVENEKEISRKIQQNIMKMHFDTQGTKEITINNHCDQYPTPAQTELCMTSDELFHLTSAPNLFTHRFTHSFQLFCLL